MKRSGLFHPYCTRVFALRVFVIILMAITACNKTKPLPELEKSVSWRFTKATSGSGDWWSTPTPNKWDIDITLNNRDTRAWMVVPNFLFLESYRGEVIAKGLTDSERAEILNMYMPFRVDNAPADTSGGIERTIVFPAAGDRYTVIWTRATLHWKLNNREMNWSPVRLTGNDSLQCHWQELNNYTFSMMIKFTPEYGLNMLGPVLYDSSDTRDVAYLMVSRSDTCMEKGKSWKSLQPELIPLTEETIMKQVGDTSRSLEWRCYFTNMIWDQPRRPGNAPELLTGLFNDRNNPLELRVVAAHSLIGTGNISALDSLKAFALDGRYEIRKRAGLLSRLYLLVPEGDLSFFKEIMDDTHQSPRLRKAASEALKNTADSLYVTPETEKALKILIIAEEHYLRAGEYYVQKLYAKAVGEYTQALDIKPEYADALNGRGGAYISTGKIGPAISDLTKAIQLEPTNSSYNLRGMCYFRNKDYSRAVSDFRKAIELNPGLPEPYSNLGLYYLTVVRDSSEGCKYLKKACELGNCSQYEMALEESECEK